MQIVDAVVVGAGFSGLAAARDLATGGARVVVLEAADRVGGRVNTLRDGDRWIELGGQWSGPGQDRLLALAAHYGVATFKTPHHGIDLHVSDGRVVPDSEVPASDAAHAVVEQLDALAATVPPTEPWRASKALQWDSLTFASWLDEEVADASARLRIRQHLEGLMTVTADRMSLLTVLHGAMTSGTLSAAMGIEGGAQELRFAGGLHQLAECLALDLGVVVRLRHEVTAIDLQGASAVVHTTQGDYRAGHVVVAVPPSGVGPIEFLPGLPSTHTDLETMMPMGSVIKLNAVFERPFWRDAGWSGLVTDDDGPLSFMVDNSSPDIDEGVLTTFLSASLAREWGDARLGVTASSQRRQLMTDHVRLVFGADSPDPIDFVDCDWVAEPWIGGGYSGVMRPKGWLSLGPSLRKPVGPVHWASSERATMWTGYVEGALESGERAAREVLASHD